MGAPIKQGLWLSMGIACAYTQCVQPTAQPSILDVGGGQSGAGHSSVVLNSPVK